MSAKSLPFDLSPDERLTTISEILAAGFVRLQRRRASLLSAQLGDCLLDLSEHQSGHAEPKCTGEAGA